jgi:hypothetical protein
MVEKALRSLLISNGMVKDGKGKGREGKREKRKVLIPS